MVKDLYDDLYKERDKPAKSLRKWRTEEDDWEGEMDYVAPTPIREHHRKWIVKRIMEKEER